MPGCRNEDRESGEHASLYAPTEEENEDSDTESANELVFWIPIDEFIEQAYSGRLTPDPVRLGFLDDNGDLITSPEQLSAVFAAAEGNLENAENNKSKPSPTWIASLAETEREMYQWMKQMQVRSCQTCLLVDELDMAKANRRKKHEDDIVRRQLWHEIFVHLQEADKVYVGEDKEDEENELNDDEDKEKKEKDEFLQTHLGNRDEPNETENSDKSY